MKPYLWNVLLGLDRFLNALTGGWPGETISSRCARKKDKYILAKVIYAILDHIQYKHCEKAEEAIKFESDIPPELRT